MLLVIACLFYPFLAFCQEEHDNRFTMESSMLDLTKLFAAQGVVRGSWKHFESLQQHNKKFILIHPSSEFSIPWVIWAWELDGKTGMAGFFPYRKDKQWVSRSFEGWESVIKDHNLFTYVKDIFNQNNERGREVSPASDYEVVVYFSEGGEVRQRNIAKDSVRPNGSEILKIGESCAKFLYEVKPKKSPGSKSSK